MEKEFYKEDWFMWVTLVLVPPVGIYLIWYFKKFNMVARIIATILFAMITTAFLGELNSDSGIKLSYDLIISIIFAVPVALINYIPQIIKENKVDIRELYSTTKQTRKNFIEEYKNCPKVKIYDYTIYEKNNSVHIYKNNLFKSNAYNEPIIINSINDIRIYEDDKEKSATGKAIVGGLTFGVVGALVGSSMRKELVRKMGIKIYTNEGAFDFRIIHGDTKKDGFVYDGAEKQLDELYNILIKYVNKH